MSQECCATTPPRMILACAGGSNVGQLSNQATVELTREGFGKRHLSGERGRAFHRFCAIRPRYRRSIVVIEGCEIGCAKAILEHADIPIKNYLVISAMGIEKNKNLKLNPAEIDLVKQAVKEVCR